MALQDKINADNRVNIALALSPNVSPTIMVTVRGRAITPESSGGHDYIISGPGVNAGNQYSVIANSVFLLEVDFFVFEQNGTLFLAGQCTDINNRCEEDGHPLDLSDVVSFPSPRTFTFTVSGSYEVDDIFYFNRGLITDARQFGDFHINAETKHVEYRWTPFSDVFIDGGFRRFGNADVSYAKMQADYNNFYLQYSLGNVRSDYYKSGKIDGVAFGWQKDGFAVKAEKPLGNGGKSWLRLFYKREIK